MKAFFVTVPHAGERVPDEAFWLKGLPEPVLMCDVDRYVDELYRPAVLELSIPFIVTEWHRYAVDLNRIPEDIDQDSVEGSSNPSGKFPIGFHWSQTTTGIKLMPKPMSLASHQDFVAKYFRPFHQQVEKQFSTFRGQGFKKIYHLDAHSMPSKGTAAHRDPGGERPQIVVSDVDGVSCETQFKDNVIAAYQSAGFKVSYNWPYKGGRVTQTYGQPAKGQHTLQVEMNRSLYMDETSKRPLPGAFQEVQEKLKHVVRQIFNAIHEGVGT